MKKRVFFSSIRFRVWMTFMLFSIVLLVVLYASQVIFFPTFYRHMKTQETIETADSIKEAWTSETLDSYETLKNMINSLSGDRQQFICINIPFNDGTNNAITYASDRSAGIGGSTLTASLKDEYKEDIFDEPNGQKLYQVTDAGKDALRLITYVGTPDKVELYIIVSSYIETLGTTSEILKYQFYISAGILILLAFAGAVFIARQISEPIVNISQLAKKLPSGEFNVHPKKHEYSEITLLSENLNTASAEIAKTENLRKDLMANVSHDLKTPLTMIKAYAEMIRDLSGDNPEKRAKHLAVIIDETDRLNALVKDILDLSKLQSNVAEINLEKINFSEHLHDIMPRFTYLRETENYNIVTEIEDGLFIEADLTKIEQVVYNLVNNAVNYAGDDRYVCIKLFRAANGSVRFEVSDHGPGIDAESLPYIWDRYYKVQKSENYQRLVAGTGLGLSIVKGVLENHNFRYGVLSEKGVGSTFWFEAPQNTKKLSVNVASLKEL